MAEDVSPPTIISPAPEPSTTTAPQSLTTPLPTTIVFFDGVCGLCNGVVDFLLWLGPPAKHLMFTPIQGETAVRLLTQKQRTDIDTVFFKMEDGLFDKSSAILKIAGTLTGAALWPIRQLTSILEFLPRSLRDSLYDVVARHRYQLFGQREACRLPSPQERLRFLS